MGRCFHGHRRRRCYCCRVLLRRCYCCRVAAPLLLLLRCYAAGVAALLLPPPGEVQMYSWSHRMGPIRHNSNSLVVQFTVPEYQEAGCCRGMASDTQLPPARHLSGAAENWGIHARRMCALRLGPLQCSTVSLVMMAVPAATSNANS